LTNHRFDIINSVMSTCKVKLVIVEWLDSTQPISSWQHLSDYKASEPISCVSVGFLIHDGIDVKALAPNMGDVSSKVNMQVSGIIHIPAKSILNITELIEKRRIIISIYSTEIKCWQQEFSFWRCIYRFSKLLMLFLPFPHWVVLVLPFVKAHYRQFFGNLGRILIFQYFRRDCRYFRRSSFFVLHAYFSLFQKSNDQVKLPSDLGCQLQPLVMPLLSFLQYHHFINCSHNLFRAFVVYCVLYGVSSSFSSIG